MLKEMLLYGNLYLIGYWEFEHIFEDVPDWISEREYSIAHEELYEPEVQIFLKTKKGRRVNWASRNRGKVVVSSKKFRKDTKNISRKS